MIPIKLIRQWDRHGITIGRIALGYWHADYSEGFIAVFRGCRGFNVRCWRFVVAVKMRERDEYGWVWKFPSGMYK